MYLYTLCLRKTSGVILSWDKIKLKAIMERASFENESYKSEKTKILYRKTNFCLN